MRAFFSSYHHLLSQAHTMLTDQLDDSLKHCAPAVPFGTIDNTPTLHEFISAFGTLANIFGNNGDTMPMEIQSDVNDSRKTSSRHPPIHVVRSALQRYLPVDLCR